MKVREVINDNGVKRVRWVEVPVCDPFDHMDHDDAVALWEDRLGVPRGTLADA